MGAEYGFSALNNSLNSQNSNNFNLFNALKLNELNVPARVLDIVLDESHPRFKELGIGGIEYELVTSPGTKGTAIYYNSSIKHYPLINEIVNVNSFPDTGLGTSNTSATKYYSGPISLWQHPHHNSYPTVGNQVNETQNKSLSQTQAGSTKVNTDQTLTIDLGSTFEERGNIHPLLPFEGDIIHEGRWGNSIRLGSTVKDKPNDWSSTGKNGDPIIIIRNGQGDQSEEGWTHIVESTKHDDSSIYMTSTQKVEFNASSTSYVSYKDELSPITPDKYSGQQIILDSGRLIFNSYSDHILLSSAKSINLNSLESVNVDTPKMIVQADNIYLGSHAATEPLLKGNLTVDVLKNLIIALKQLNNTFRDLQTQPIVNLGQPVSLDMSVRLASITLNTTLTSIESQLKDLTSQYNYTV